MLRVSDGVRIERVVDRAGACVAEHAHDWPVLCVHVMGGYDNHTELGACRLDGPSAILYRAGARHENVVASHGFEQIEIEFDADWLGAGFLPDAPCTLWRIIKPASARTLRTCATSGSSAQLRSAM